MANTKKLLQAAAGSAVGGDYYNAGNLQFEGTGSIPERNFQATIQDVGDLFFKSDGSILFLVGEKNDANLTRVVQRYNLSTAWDISTANLSPDQELDLSNQSISTNPRGIHFKPDGTELYVLDYQNQKTYQYTLSTGFDLSTASYTRVFTHPSSGQSGYAANPSDIIFSPDGLYMYITDSSSEYVIRFVLSTAWDISTASYYATTTLDTNNVHGIDFNSDGSKFFAADSGSVDKVVEYDISAYTAYTIPGGSITNSGTKAINPPIGAPSGFFYKNSSTFFVSDSTIDSVFRYSFGATDDISTSTNVDFPTSDYYQGYTDISSSPPDYITFKPDGTRLYFAHGGDDSISEYTLSTAWELDTATYSRKFSTSTQGSSVSCVQFKPDGTEMYTFDTAQDTFFKYDLSTAWNVTTASLNSSSGAITADINAQSQCFTFNDDGTEAFVGSLGGIYKVNLSTAYDLPNVTFPTFPQKYIGNVDGSSNGLHVKPDGTQVYWVGHGNDKVYKKDVATAWDVTSLASATSDLSLTAYETNPSGIFIRPDGTRGWVVGRTDDSVIEINFSTAWDLGSASPSGTEFDVSANTPNPEDIFWSSDGMKFFCVSGRDVDSYTVTSAWGIGNASYDTSNGTYTNDYEPAVNAISFKTDGTEMYLAGSTSDAVHQFTLSTAWEPHTATYTTTYYPPNTSAIEGMRFKSDGLKFWLTDRTSDMMLEYELTTAWDLSTAYWNTSSGDFLNTSKDFLPRALGQTTPTAICFDETGEHLYVQSRGVSPSLLAHYTVTTPFSLIGAELQEIVSTAAEGEVFNIKPDFSKAYLGGKNFDIYELQNSQA